MATKRGADAGATRTYLVKSRLDFDTHRNGTRIAEPYEDGDEVEMTEGQAAELLEAGVIAEQPAPAEKADKTDKTAKPAG